MAEKDTTVGNEVTRILKELDDAAKSLARGQKPFLWLYSQTILSQSERKSLEDRLFRERQSQRDIANNQRKELLG